MLPEDDITKLLKLKRYEQPPPGYFDEFLRDFQARQRAELIRRPLWKLAKDRISPAVVRFRVPKIAYAAIATLALIASISILLRPTSSTAPLVATQQQQQVSLSSTAPVTIGEPLPVVKASSGSQSSVHYVLPQQPVSYAPPESF